MRFLPFLTLALALAAAPALGADAGPKTPAEINDELYDRLAKTADAEEAAGIVKAIDLMAMRSGSDSADLLMARATAAFAADEPPLALSLLDALVAVDPAWAEGWSERASLRYLTGDSRGAVVDIAETLKRNPRHLGALMQLAAIFDESGGRDHALAIYERVLALAPAYSEARQAAGKLRARIAGQGL